MSIDLLAPRFKVVADWPKNYDFTIGEIITCNDMVTEAMIGNPRFSLYPHLFKKLEWYEDREEKDMPEYVKCTYQTGKKGENIVISKFSMKDHFFNKQYHEAGVIGYEPATESDYINQSTIKI